MEYKRTITLSEIISELVIFFSMTSLSSAYYLNTNWNQNKSILLNEGFAAKYINTILLE